MAGTVFHLVRHASHDLLGKVLVGRGPVSLNARGRAEAAAAAETLAGAGLAAMASSPRERALQTADVIAARAGLTVVVEPGLDELDMGDWTGLGFDALAGDPHWQAFNAFRSSAPVPGGEPMLAAQARALAAILRLRAAYPDAAVALVSHADVIKAVLMHFLGMPLDAIHRIDVAPASVSVVELFDRDAVVRTLNRLPDPPAGEGRAEALPDRP